MNGSIKKLLNAVFRAVIFCCAVASVMMIVKIVNFSVEVEEKQRLTDGIIENIQSFASIFSGLAYATLACAVLSVLTNNYKASGAAVVFRTGLLGITAYNLFKGSTVVKAMSESCELLSGFDVSDYDDITNEMLTEAGVTEQKAQKLIDAMNDESAILAMILAMCLCIAVYVLLSFTSLHNLLKKQGGNVNCGGCEDASRLEQGDASMLAGGGHYAPQDMPQILQNMNRELGGGIENSKLINRYMAAAQQHAHDHHDSAEAHDMEADGEFTGYAQAEADIRDSGDDYVSELLNEENSSGRITDETFM